MEAGGLQKPRVVALGGLATIADGEASVADVTKSGTDGGAALRSIESSWRAVDRRRPGWPIGRPEYSECIKCTISTIDSQVNGLY